MRISDWSSDVCSSDLRHQCRNGGFAGESPICGGLSPSFCLWRAHRSICQGSGFRSEEHTSELQSLMRISYAVFCLTKKFADHQHVHIATVHNDDFEIGRADL